MTILMGLPCHYISKIANQWEVEMIFWGWLGKEVLYLGSYQSADGHSQEAETNVKIPLRHNWCHKETEGYATVTEGLSCFGDSNQTMHKWNLQPFYKLEHYSS